VSYTALAGLGVVGAAALDLLVLRTRLLVRRAFWTAYAIMLSFQVLTNGWLTCRHIVVYDRHAILGPRLLCAPVEDVFFGFSLILQTLAWWVWWGRRDAGRLTGGAPPAQPEGRREQQEPSGGEQRQRAGEGECPGRLHGLGGSPARGGTAR